MSVVTSENVELHVTLWKKSTTRDDIVVEIQRRRGDSVAFQRYATWIMDAAHGRFVANNSEQQLTGDSTTTGPASQAASACTSVAISLAIIRGDKKLQRILRHFVRSVLLKKIAGLLPMWLSLLLDAIEFRSLLSLLQDRPRLHDEVAEIMYTQERAYNSLKTDPSSPAIGFDHESEHPVFLFARTPRNPHENSLDLEALEQVLFASRRRQVKLLLLALRKKLRDDQQEFEENGAALCQFFQ